MATLLTPAGRARLGALRKQMNEGIDLSVDEEIEYDHLVHTRDLERLTMVPRPTCCAAARWHPAVWFLVSVYHGDSHANDGHWETLVYNKAARELRTLELQGARDAEIAKEQPAAKFCPYCGAPLPTMRRKAIIPATVMRVTDGGYYCDTCKERMSNCFCDPPEAAFEVVP
jgi:hypothetical protein